MLIKYLFSIILILYVLIFFPCSSFAQTLPTPIPLINTTNPNYLRDFFLDYAGINPFNQTPYTTGIEFGIYVLEPVDNTLYLGISAGAPADLDGALLAKFENNLLTPILNNVGEYPNPISEQGIHDMFYKNGVLYIPGTDPADPGDQWSWGNIYTYTPGGLLVKHRNLPNVLHTWGLWVDDLNLYAGTGSHTGDNQTWIGQILKTNLDVFNNPEQTDPLIIWPPEDRITLSPYRVKDIIGFNNKLYALPTNSNITWLSYSADNGKNWNTIEGVFPNAYTRLETHQNKLIGIGYRQQTSGSVYSDALYTVDSNHHVSLYPLPENTVINTATQSLPPYDLVYHALTTDSSGNLYLLTHNYDILQTNDLINWRLVAHFDKPLNAISYWPLRNLLIAGEKGPEAKLWQIDLSENPVFPAYIPPSTITPTPSPTPTPTMSVSKYGKIEYGSANDFYSVNPDGTNSVTILSKTELTPPYNYIEDASFSIDGKLLSFVAARNNNNSYTAHWNYKIMTKSILDGTIEEWLPEQPEGAVITNPHLSPDNTEIYFSMVKPYADQIADTGHYSGISGIFKVKRGEKELIKIIDYPPVWTKYQMRDITPDGQKLLLEYSGDASVNDYFDIYISNADGSNRINLTNSMFNVKKSKPSFSNDGKKIIYHEVNPDNSTYDLKVIDLDTREKKFIHPTADYNENYSCYSPDSTQIIYHARSVSSPYANVNLYLANADGTNPVNILNVVYSKVPQMHCWAPDPRYTPPFSCSVCDDNLPSKLTGNANCDQKINSLDFALWKKVLENPLSTEEEKSMVDFNCQPTLSTHTINLEDFILWSLNSF